MMKFNQTFFEMVCENYKDDGIKKNYNIGYSHMRWPFLVVPSLALTLNLFIIITHIRKSLNNKKKQIENPSTSIEQMLYSLTIVETLISIYWLCNGAFFYTVKTIQEKCEACFFDSIFFIFIQTFDWAFFTCSLHNILCFVQDPLKEQGFRHRLKLYVMISIGVAGLFTYCVFATGTYGLSPMLTCFIKNNFREPNKDIAVYSILAVPTCYLVFSIYSFVRVFKHTNVKTSSNFKIAVVKYMIYSLLYIFFYFPSIILYILSINQDIEKDTFLSWFSYFCTLATVSINLALCVFRILEGYVKCHWKALLVHQDLDESLMTEDQADESSQEENLGFNHNYKIGINEAKKASISTVEHVFTPSSSFALNNTILKSSSKRRLSSWNKISLEMIQGFMRNFFVGLIMCLDKSRNLKVERVMKSRYYTEEAYYSFKYKKSDHADQILSVDISIVADEDINLEVIEYAPKVFKRIRALEGISEEEIIESLNPVNNTTIIKSQGKSNSFFISTDDSKLVLKTLKKEEFDNIFNKFLYFYLNHTEINKNSLICRIYGIFSVKAYDGADPLLIVLMRNAKGPFKNYITRTYDLKGSRHNRETAIDDVNENKPFLARKDLNFLKNEQRLELKQRNKFIENATRDSEFFEDLNLMDYSLLLLKLEFDETSADEYKRFAETKDFVYYERHIYFSIKNPKIAFICVIIDYLQDFNFLKKMENNIKNFITERPETCDLISCVPADVYSKRFIEFLRRITNI